jgi:cyclopropane fatty-acyl-phospholipid synthase-like methyltransferase
MKNQAVGREQMVAYYDQAEIDYRLVLDLDRSLALHFGYWDDTTRSMADALARENQVLADLVKPDSSSAVLDAGCGVGGSSIYLAKRFGCRVVGITLSRQQVVNAHRNAERHGVAALTEFLERDFTRTGFPDRSFDVVWAIESVCHADDKAEFLREAFRLLRPGGRLVVADGFAVKDDYTASERTMMQKWLNGWGVNFLETSENFRRYLADSGFRNIAFTDVTANVLPTSKRLYFMSYPALFFGKILQWLGLRTKIQTGNVIAARYQHLTLRRGLWHYGICYAEK